MRYCGDFFLSMIIHIAAFFFLFFLFPLFFVCLFVCCLFDVYVSVCDGSLELNLRVLALSLNYY